jgi:hypothetical protein
MFEAALKSDGGLSKKSILRGWRELWDVELWAGGDIEKRKVMSIAAIVKSLRRR